IAFYNTDNMFDVFDDPDTLDDDFTPTGDKKWTLRRYKNKIEKIGEVISTIGLKHAKLPPIFVGLAELENQTVLLDLVESKKLAPFNYDYVHYDSPDERGIDVGFIYQKAYFELLDSKIYPLMLFDERGKRDYTRDMLLVKGKLHGVLVYIIINHWPSRRAGTELTESKRIAAANRVHEIINEVQKETRDANIIIMGDFNDGPNDTSINNHLVTDDFYNPMQAMKDKGEGSLVYKKKWILFDQIIMSKTFFNDSVIKLKYKYADIFNPKYIRTWKGKNKDNPHRTYIGRWHQGGVSDHFPVFVYFEKL
ncbi:TPA: endonuclease, partial [Candidatus Poribacteria bacterium]|nr:endonuclease [Candidatus Poribacteria bacterium]